jgi:hypothetical protein
MSSRKEKQVMAAKKHKKRKNQTGTLLSASVKGRR